MNKKIIPLILSLFAFLSLWSQEQSLKKGMVIRKPVKIKKALYSLNAFDSLNKAVVTIEGNNIVVDFKNATLQGSNDKKLPNEYYGLAILVRNGKNITIRNLKARGYKVALMAVNVEGLKIENCDFSYNYRQRLNSTQEKEDVSDWMSFHHNDNDEWLRYGAAMYLKNCTGFTVSDCRVTGGQNALMLVRSNSGMVYNNDFSFNSGVGLGLYRSSGNRVLHNRINFNVRGYSHGVYNRGQDSAGILVYEQSNGNLFYRNSVTHGGDGFFLWAGQTTMDTGQGGCNDNQLIENDFSYAPTNGIEVTFSRNHILKNRIFECDHGIWGGYSYETTIAGNQFRNNRIAVAIEHGQHNKIENNIFYRDKEAIRLWARTRQPPDWGYAKFRDTRSVDYLITLNSFNQNPLVYHFTRTDSIKIFNNRYAYVEQVFSVDSTVSAIDSLPIELLDTLAVDYSLNNARDPFKGNGKLAGRKNILITEWGPYDFGYPIIWNTNPTGTSDTMDFDVLGPKGKWKILSMKGLELATVPDTFPSRLRAIKRPGERTDIELVAEYRGPAFTDAFGRMVPANKPYRFMFKKYFQPILFSVSFYEFDSTTNPIRTDYRERVKTLRPFKIESTDRLDYAWWGGIKQGEQVHRQFLTIADGTAELEAGEYEIGITWDDAVRLYVDGKLLVDEWNPSKYQFDESPHKKIRLQLEQGQHGFRVEHVELGGFATLSLKLTRVR